MANYKYWFKPLVEVKDLMLNLTNKAKTTEYDTVNPCWDRPIHGINTEIELSDHKITLNEEYQYNEYHYFDSDITAYYKLTVEKPDGQKSVLELGHFFGKGEEQLEINKFLNLKDESFKLYKHTGIFDFMKPSELPMFYKSWCYINYDRRQEEWFKNLNKKAS